jgi:hypothetical protein
MTDKSSTWTTTVRTWPPMSHAYTAEKIGSLPHLPTPCTFNAPPAPSCLVFGRSQQP